VSVAAAAVKPVDPRTRGNVSELPFAAALIRSGLGARAQRLRVVVGRLADAQRGDAAAYEREAAGALAETIRCADDLAAELERLAAIAATYTDAENLQGDRAVVHEQP
jgi:hypothetical protein